MIAPIRRVLAPQLVVQPVLDLAVAILELDAEGAGEVLAEVVRGCRLERRAIAHHRLQRVGAQRPGELLGLGLESRDDRNRQFLLDEVLIDLLEDQHRLRLGLVLVAVDGMALLPEELGGAQEGRVRFSQRTTFAHWL